MEIGLSWCKLGRQPLLQKANETLNADQDRRNLEPTIENAGTKNKLLVYEESISDVGVNLHGGGIKDISVKDMNSNYSVNDDSLQ